MSSSISKIADEINLHGSWEAYCAWRDRSDGVQHVYSDFKDHVQIRLESHLAIQLPWMSDPLIKELGNNPQVG